MPQMAPLSWIYLFLTFITIFMLLNTLNYFSFTYKNKKSSVKSNLLKTNWKW